MESCVRVVVGIALAGVFAPVAVAQVSITSVSRTTHASECLTVPPGYVEYCEADDDDNQTAGPWLGSGSFGNGAANNETNYANGTAEVFQSSEVTSAMLQANSTTKTWVQSAGNCSVQASAISSFAVQFSVAVPTLTSITASFTTSGGFGSASLVRVGGASLFSTAGEADEQLVLAPGAYQFIASSMSSGDCASGCEYAQMSTWNAAVTFQIPPCRADFNGDSFLDFTDFDDFVVAFEGGQSSSDFNGDGFLDFTDFDDFVMSFELGC